LIVTRERVLKVQNSMPELPEERANRFTNDFGLPAYDAQVISQSAINSQYFEELCMIFKGKLEAKSISNYFMTDIMRACKVMAEKRNIAVEELSEIPIPISHSEQILELQLDGTISNRIAREVFEEMMLTGKSPKDIISEKNLVQIKDDSQARKICEDVIAKNPQQVQEYLSGKDKLFGFLVGQAMKASGGKLNPAQTNEILKELLKK
jgi:aspartyl-tRNA(Asn)/glutamyl-tRNA(Gln) amidotransferase subunit B